MSSFPSMSHVSYALSEWTNKLGVDSANSLTASTRSIQDACMKGVNMLSMGITFPRQKIDVRIRNMVFLKKGKTNSSYLINETSDVWSSCNQKMAYEGSVQKSRICGEFAQKEKPEGFFCASYDEFPSFSKNAFEKIFSKFLAGESYENQINITILQIAMANIVIRYLDRDPIRSLVPKKIGIHLFKTGPDRLGINFLIKAENLPHPSTINKVLFFTIVLAGNGYCLSQDAPGQSYFCEEAIPRGFKKSTEFSRVGWALTGWLNQFKSNPTDYLVREVEAMRKDCSNGTNMLSMEFSFPENTIDLRFRSTFFYKKAQLNCYEMIDRSDLWAIKPHDLQYQKRSLRSRAFGQYAESEKPEGSFFALYHAFPLFPQEVFKNKLRSFVLGESFDDLLDRRIIEVAVKFFQSYLANYIASGMIPETINFHLYKSDIDHLTMQFGLNLHVDNLYETFRIRKEACYEIKKENDCIALEMERSTSQSLTLRQILALETPQEAAPTPESTLEAEIDPKLKRNLFFV